MKTSLLFLIALAFMLGAIFADAFRVPLPPDPQTIVRKGKSDSLLPPRLYRAQGERRA